MSRRAEISFIAEELAQLRPVHKRVRRHFLAEVVRIAIARCDGNKTKAIALLGIHRSNVNQAARLASQWTISEDQFRVVKDLAAAISTEVKFEYFPASALFDRAMAEAALRLAPKHKVRLRGAAEAFEKPNRIEAARMIGVHRNLLVRLERATPRVQKQAHSPASLT